LINFARAPFVAIFRTEVRLNSKRVVPYAMAVLCGGNALLWWGWGPAALRGWGLATNSEAFIAGVMPVFSFMTLPLFTAVIMGDPVVRDFRAGVTPLIFSKPVSRTTYLLGKFSGNFFTLVCCQAAFPLTLFVLQWFRKAHMIVQPVRVLPYFEHFLALVVVSHLVLAAFYFAVGTLTQSAKIVYGLAVSFYPIYIAYQMICLKGLPQRWRVLLDPLVMNWQKDIHGQSAEALNQLAISYGADILLNRALMMLIAAVCLSILYLRFSTVERSQKYKGDDQLTTIDLATSAEWLEAGSEIPDFARPVQFEESARKEVVAIPKVNVATEGARANLRQLLAALGVEFRLLFAERSLVVLVPVSMLVCFAGLGYYDVVTVGSYSAAYAGRAGESLLLFLVAVAVFYTGEAMHRDRELRVEPVLWSFPAPNFVLLLSKFAATLLLSIFLSATTCLTAIATQTLRGHTPIEPLPYLAVCALILIPNASFLVASATALDVLARDKYLAYALSIGVGVGLFYLYSRGYNGWLYNPLLYGLWTPPDLTRGAKRLPQILTHRIYVLALAALCLSLAHLFFERKSKSGSGMGGHLRGKGWTILIASITTAIAFVMGWLIYYGRYAPT
jgi:ABC-type transport system involved in multi-copper enzyme maturation permease subunit